MVSPGEEFKCDLGTDDAIKVFIVYYVIDNNYDRVYILRIKELFHVWNLFHFLLNTKLISKKINKNKLELISLISNVAPLHLTLTRSNFPIEYIYF